MLLSVALSRMATLFPSFLWTSSAVNDFPKQCVLKIGPMQWNTGRHTKLRTKSGRKHRELQLAQRKALQHETHDKVLSVVWHRGSLQPDTTGFLLYYSFIYLFFLFVGRFSSCKVYTTKITSDLCRVSTAGALPRNQKPLEVLCVFLRIIMIPPSNLCLLRGQYFSKLQELETWRNISEVLLKYFYFSSTTIL